MYTQQFVYIYLLIIKKDKKMVFFVVGCSVVVIKNNFDILISNSSINYVSFDRMEIGNRWKKFLLIF